MTQKNTDVADQLAIHTSGLTKSYGGRTVVDIKLVHQGQGVHVIRVVENDPIPADFRPRATRSTRYRSSSTTTSSSRRSSGRAWPRRFSADGTRLLVPAPGASGDMH